VTASSEKPFAVEMSCLRSSPSTEWLDWPGCGVGPIIISSIPSTFWFARGRRKGRKFFFNEVKCVAKLAYVIEVLRVTSPNFLVADDSKKTLLCAVVVQDRRRCAEEFL
jgi:hypothetical protein